MVTTSANESDDFWARDSLKCPSLKRSYKHSLDRWDERGGGGLVNQAR